MAKKTTSQAKPVAPKRLYRSRNKIIAGVCAGFAEYLDMDPVLIRLIFVALTLVTGVIAGLLFYVIAWIVMPQR